MNLKIQAFKIPGGGGTVADGLRYNYDIVAEFTVLKF